MGPAADLTVPSATWGRTINFLMRVEGKVDSTEVSTVTLLGLLILTQHLDSRLAMGQTAVSSGREVRVQLGGVVLRRRASGAEGNSFRG